MIKELHNVTAILNKTNPYIIDAQNNVLLTDYYKFRPMKQKLKPEVTKMFTYDSLYYIPCEENIYHATVHSSLYFAIIPQDTIVLSNNCKVCDFYAKHFKIHVLDTHGIYHVNTLFYFENKGPTYMQPSNFDSMTFNRFLMSTSKICKVCPQLSKRIYIKRKSPKRNIENFQIVEDMLHTKGFETVYMEDLSLTQQINYFYNAKFIIAVHGAGLTNIIYCQKDCTVIELKHKCMNEFLIHNCYAQLANQAKLQNYHVHYVQHKQLSKCKSKDYNLVIDSNALSTYIDNLEKST